VERRRACVGYCRYLRLFGWLARIGAFSVWRLGEARKVLTEAEAAAVDDWLWREDSRNAVVRFLTFKFVYLRCDNIDLATSTC
jgi:hypothetical protein